ncbi:hypothetical protein OG874_25245 [Nocardia sp. NBC_00565]|uniref:hypothetical protein n=1 Tax=Nocardia sp. NBC_00565 TaxID=2975993 RepID=UPI002E80CEF8|nr:hypothetical protein [Nocardia sp. NBC_00565]WUC00206.1 hypothetical protein OG874_25245 [Nocardia sp. NBC_00565]
MSSSGKSLEQRVHELELWRDHQITRDTVTVTQIHEQLAALHTSVDDVRVSIGDLDGRSVASRLISMSVDINNMASRQDVMDGRLDSMGGRLDSMDGRLDSMGGRLGSLESDVGTLKSDVAQILQILRNPNGNR